MFQDGFTKLGPHRGHYLLHDDGAVTFLDLGACSADAPQVDRLTGPVRRLRPGHDDAVDAVLETVAGPHAVARHPSDRPAVR